MNKLKGPPVPTWEDLRRELPREVLDAVQTGLRPRPDIGPRRFFDFVAQSRHEAAVACKAFFESDRGDYAQPKSAQVVANAIQVWTEQAQASGLWEGVTLDFNRRLLISAMALASEGAKLPRIARKSLPPISRGGNQYTKLGDLPWAEFEGVSTGRRDALALELLSTQYVGYFGQHEDVFLRGRELLGSEGAKLLHRQRELEVLQRLIEAEHKNWTKKGCSVFSVPWSKKLLSNIEVVRDVELWQDLGLPAPKVTEYDGRGHPTGVASLITSCVGPNFECGMMVQGLTAVSIGWNKQPIQKMSRNPYLYRSKGRVRIGSERMLTEFKTRAGHWIVGLDDYSEARGMQLESLNSLFDDVSSDTAFSAADDFATLNTSSDIISVLERYSRMTSAIRSFLPTDTANFFFVGISPTHKKTGFRPERDLRSPMLEGPVSRKGTTFSAVRKSVLFVLDRNGLGTEEVRARANHNTSGKLELFYRTDAFAVAEREKAVRLFMECIQAITVDEKIALKIGLPERQRTWFANVASLNGISSACGPAPVLDDDGASDDFVFVPDRHSLLDLYLSHRALKRAEAIVGPIRWAIQGRILLAMVIAIIRSLLAKGLRHDYQKAVAFGLAGLASGTLSLPAVLEV